METRKFILTSDKFKGEVLFEFTDSILTKYDTSNAELSDKQMMYIASILPRDLSCVNVLFEHSASAKFTEIKQEITFEMFWNKYDDKANSSKIKTEKKWNKMPISEQIKAYNHIQKYFSVIPFGTRKKYATTYLNDELWNN